MAQSEIITLPKIGEILFERSARAKHINITVKPFKMVRVAVPKGVSFKKAEKVAESKSLWIVKQITRTKKLEAHHKAFISTSEAIDKKDAKQKIINRLDDLSEKHDIPYNRVFIRNQKTRWGSCSSKKNISLNMKIIRLPKKLMDYVIIHELVHIQHGNHSKKFWEALNNRLTEDARSLNKQLDAHRMILL